MHATTEDGAPAAPLPQADAERKLAAIDPDIKTKLLQPTQLPHGQSVTGFVFFPDAAYAGGSIALVDEQTGEADDYDVHFSTGP